MTRITLRDHLVGENMTLLEYVDAQGFEFFKLIALYEPGGVIGHLPVAIWRRSKYRECEILAVDGDSILIRGVSK